MPVCLSQIHMKNAAAKNVHGGLLANGRCACNRAAREETKRFRIEMWSVYLRTTPAAIHAIQPNGQLRDRNVTTSDAKHTGAWTNGLM